jgi:indolepyruvate ferredoxin oxidoreductase, alpha subunit
VEDVLEVDPCDLDATEKALRYAVGTGKPSVVITKRACVLIEKGKRLPAPIVNTEVCTSCGLCLMIGCPSIESVPVEVGKPKVRINADTCTSCDVCTQVCRTGAIERIQHE